MIAMLLWRPTGPVPREGVLRPWSQEFYGYGLYFISLLTMGGIYAVLTLGLNVQWGFTGLFNAGIAGFFGIGAYTTAFLTTAPSVRHLGGYEMPVRGRIRGRDAGICGVIAYGDRQGVPAASK